MDQINNTVNNVVDWDAALDQCGDDEAFLRELFVDLYTEIQTQIHKIQLALTGTGNFMSGSVSSIRLGL